MAQGGIFSGAARVTRAVSMAVGAAVRAAGAAFRKEYLSTSADYLDRDRFGLYMARAQRYRLYEALWENTAYDSGRWGIHPWANAWKSFFGLYKYTRGVYNPSNRLIEFWATHLMGGDLDLAAGDGVNVPSALPILTPAENPALRAAIGKLWADSNWRTEKTVWGRQGALYGDAVLRLAIDGRKQRVRLVPVHPKNLVDLSRADDGEVLGYVIEETRIDPERPRVLDAGGLPWTCTYAETCERDGGKVVFKTYRNGEPYNWRGVDDSGAPKPPAWEAPWPFVPLVAVQHIRLGLEFGVGELHAAITKIAETDDAGSKLNDYLRRAVQTKWFFSGIAQRADLDPGKSAKPPTPENPQPGREEELLITAKAPEARAAPLIPPLDIADALGLVNAGQETVERDFPELRYDRLRASGDASAKALREARKPVVTRVNERRDGYDQALAKIQQMAVAIGGELGFPGYEGFGVEDWGTDRLAHSIGARPVFEVEAADRAEEDLAEAQAVVAWTSAGVPLEVALERSGWPDEVVEQIRQIKAAAEASMLASQKALLDAGAVTGGGQ